MQHAPSRQMLKPLLALACAGVLVLCGVGSRGGAARCALVLGAVAVLLVPAVDFLCAPRRAPAAAPVTRVDGAIITKEPPVELEVAPYSPLLAPTAERHPLNPTVQREQRQRRLMELQKQPTQDQLVAARTGLMQQLRALVSVDPYLPQ
jgi:hypothetical protein